MHGDHRHRNIRVTIGGHSHKSQQLQNSCHKVPFFIAQIRFSHGRWHMITHANHSRVFNIIANCRSICTHCIYRHFHLRDTLTWLTTRVRSSRFWVLDYLSFVIGNESRLSPTVFIKDRLSCQSILGPLTCSLNMCASKAWSVLHGRLTRTIKGKYAPQLALIEIRGIVVFPEYNRVKILW